MLKYMPILILLAACAPSDRIAPRQPSGTSAAPAAKAITPADLARGLVTPADGGPFKTVGRTIYEWRGGGWKKIGRR